MARGTHVMIRLTETEARELRAKAKKSGMTVSQYARRALDDAPIYETIAKEGAA